MMDKNIFYFPVRVYYEDTDAGGIVYYANYLKFFERCRTEWLRTFDIEQDVLIEQSVGFVVKRVEMDNHLPARFNQTLSVSCQIVELKRASVIFKQHIYNNEHQVLVSATIRVACVNLQKLKPIAIPPNIFREMQSAV